MKAALIALCCILSVSTIFAQDNESQFGLKPPKTSKSKKKTAFRPPPTPTPPGMPSADLGRFVGANLEKILGPVEVKTPMPRAELAQLRTSFSAGFSKASLAQRNQYQTALSVCNALSQAMDERDRAALNPAGSNWAQRSTQLRAGIQQLMEQEKAAEASAASGSGH